MPRIFDNIDQQLLPALCQTIDLSEFYASKSIIDEIDSVLARHYGLTADELDFIVNYDIKYRMGRDAESTGGDGQ